jgi:hypothetical protein
LHGLDRAVKADRACFEAIPSSPILQACLKMIAPSPSMCFDSRTPVVRAINFPKVALRLLGGW